MALFATHCDLCARAGRDQLCSVRAGVPLLIGQFSEFPWQFGQGIEEGCCLFDLVLRVDPITELLIKLSKLPVVIHLCSAVAKGLPQ